VPSILFVCVENSFRSVMAEALFNAIAPMGWRAHSAGVDAKGKTVNPLAFSLMEEIGIVVTKTHPRQVAPEMINEAWRVVTFGCLDRCPAAAAGKNEDWPVPGSAGKTDSELRAIRTDLQARVEDLIRRLPK
jgi:arsenate reductase